MAKAKVQASTNLYESQIETKYGTVLVSLPKNFPVIYPARITHLQKRRHIEELNPDKVVQLNSQKQYSKDPFVKTYLAEGLEYLDAVNYSIRDYRAIDADSQLWALITILLESMFVESLEGKRHMELSGYLEPFPLDENSYEYDQNPERINLGDPPIPAYDSNSVLEQRIAYIKTLSKLDSSFEEKLTEVVREASAVVGQEGDSKEVEDGFHS